jgi:hypothetical protein
MKRRELIMSHNSEIQRAVVNTVMNIPYGDARTFWTKFKPSLEMKVSYLRNPAIGLYPSQLKPVDTRSVFFF